MISLPSLISLCADLVNEVFMVEDSLKIWFSMQTFIALPATINSKLFLCPLLVRFATLCSCTVLGVDICLESEISPLCAVESMKVVENSVDASTGSVSTAERSLLLA